MAYDLFFGTETDANWARGPSIQPLPLDFTPTERKVLKLLEPSTASFAVNLVGWARQKGIPARLSHTAIYSPEDVEKNYNKGRSSIAPDRLSWHSVGRAFHLVINRPDGSLDKDAYARVGAYARTQGGDWLGDKPIKTTKGIIYDTAHYEYHPGIDIANYRKSPIALREYDQAQKRAKRYA